MCMWRPEIQELLLCQTEGEPKHGSSKCKIRIVAMCCYCQCGVLLLVLLARRLKVPSNPNLSMRLAKFSLDVRFLPNSYVFKNNIISSKNY